jgi:hypothetical protein
MQRLEVSDAVRHIYIYMSLGGKGLIYEPTEHAFTVVGILQTLFNHV